jgi:multidrug efflux pump subunit AcrA (membrane-fusion protein)
MRKILTQVIAVLLAVTLSGCASIEGAVSSVFPQQTEAPAKTTTSKAAVGDLVLGLSADGSITLPVTGLDFAVSGIIKAIHVKAGDIVNEGDLLAELDDTELQLALRTAQNNLEKARLSYEETLSSAEYNLKSETLNLEATKEKLNAAFDPYTYEQSIENARLTLERRKQDYEDAVLSCQAAEDAARLALKRRQESVTEAEADLEYTKTGLDDAYAEVAEAEAAVEEARDGVEDAKADVVNAQEDVAEAQSDLEEARVELAKAQNAQVDDFDAFNLNNNIKSAELNAERMKKNLNDASKELTAAKSERDRLNVEYQQALFDYETYVIYNTAMQYEITLQAPSDADYVKAQETVTAKEKARYTAQLNYDDALTNLEIANANLTRENESYIESEEEKLQSAVESAGQTVEQAEQSVEQAQEGVEQAQDSVEQAEKAVEQAIKNVEQTKKSITQAEQSILQGERSIAQAKQQAEDAQTSLEQTILDNENKLISAKQSVDDAETALKNAETELIRGREQFNESLADTQSSYELQTLKLENIQNNDLSIKNAEYAIEEAETALETAQNNLEKIKIYATISGEVLNVTKNVGEKATETVDGPGMFMGSGSTSNSFITIRDLSSIYMSASVPEGDIVGLSVGQKIRVAVDALGEENISATVYSISSIPNTDTSGIISYEIVGVLDEFNPEIRDQMSVFLTFIKKEINGVLLIPNKSVFVEDGQQYVYVQNGGEALEKRAVTCGFSNGSQTEVQQGLQAGETVVVGKVTL